MRNEKNVCFEKMNGSRLNKKNVVAGAQNIQGTISDRQKILSIFKLIKVRTFHKTLLHYYTNTAN